MEKIEGKQKDKDIYIDTKTYIKSCIKNAINSVENGDLRACIIALKDAEKGLPNSNLKSQIGTLLPHIELMIKEELKPTPKTIENLKDLLTVND